MNNTDHQVKYNLDQILVQLADILRKLGVEDYQVTDSQESHIISNEAESDAQAKYVFCSQVAGMFEKIVGLKK